MTVSFNKPATYTNINQDDTLVSKRDKNAMFTVIEKGKHVILQALYPADQANLSFTPNEFDEAEYFHYDETGFTGFSS